MTGAPASYGTARCGVELLGCGNVGTALAEILLARQEDVAARTGIHLELVGIAVSERQEEAAMPDKPKALLEHGRCR